MAVALGFAIATPGCGGGGGASSAATAPDPAGEARAIIDAATTFDRAARGHQAELRRELVTLDRRLPGQAERGSRALGAAVLTSLQGVARVLAPDLQALADRLAAMDPHDPSLRDGVAALLRTIRGTLEFREVDLGAPGGEDRAQELIGLSLADRTAIGAMVGRMKALGVSEEQLAALRLVVFDVGR